MNEKVEVAYTPTPEQAAFWHRKAVQENLKFVDLKSRLNHKMTAPSVTTRIEELLTGHPAERLRPALEKLPDEDLLCLLELHRWEYKRVPDANTPSLLTPYVHIRKCVHCNREENV